MNNVWRRAAAVFSGPRVILLNGRPFSFRRHTLIFTHIPKNGGTSLHAAFESVFGGHYRLFYGAPGELENLDQLKGAGGHHYFGTNPMHGVGKKLVYVTVLRHPFHRFVSYYRYVLSNKFHYLRLADPSITALGPLEFAKHLVAIGNEEIANLQSRMLTPGATTASAVVAHVERTYSVVGIFEELDDFARALSTMFPERPINLPHLNGRETDDLEVNEDLFDYVMDLNQLDFEVYRHFRALRPRRHPAPATWDGLAGTGWTEQRARDGDPSPAS